MITSQFEIRLYQKLEGFFHAEGFELIIDKKQFRRTYQNSFQNIIFAVSEVQKEFWIEVNFGIRNHQIEQIAQQFLNNLPNFRNDANTLVINIGKYNNMKYFRFKVIDDYYMDDITFEIKDFFFSKGFGFLEDSIFLSEIDRILNDKPTQNCPFLYNQVHRCFKGTIVAKLTDRLNFADLVGIYREFLLKTATDEELFNYERLVSFLLHYNPN